VPYSFLEQDPCPVCEQLAGRGGWALVAGSATAAAFVPSRQPAAGTTLIVPRRHVLEPGALPAGEQEDLWLLLRRMVGATMAVFEPASYHVSQYVGEITDEPLAHLWWRLEPRDQKPPSTETRIAELPVVPEQERGRQAELLRAELERLVLPG
jgi:diadenosine tetraphosphate (Ap4A) HIT family hydrolase